MPCGVKVKGCVLCEDSGGTNSGGIEPSTAIENLQNSSSCSHGQLGFPGGLSEKIRRMPTPLGELVFRPLMRLPL